MATNLQVWLNGLENAPQKLQNLGELNKMLAHRPWLITKEHIEVGLSWTNVNVPFFSGKAITDSWGSEPDRVKDVLWQ